MAEIMEQALDIALDQKDLKKKRARRLERKSKSIDNSRPEFCPGKVLAKSRYIPSHVRERVHERAGYQCQYRGPDGGLVVARERGSRSSTCGPFLFIETTTKGCSGFTAAPTTA